MRWDRAKGGREGGREGGRSAEAGERFCNEEDINTSTNS